MHHKTWHQDIKDYDFCPHRFVKKVKILQETTKKWRKKFIAFKKYFFPDRTTSGNFNAYAKKYWKWRWLQNHDKCFVNWTGIWNIATRLFLFVTLAIVNCRMVIDGDEWTNWGLHIELNCMFWKSMNPYTSDTTIFDKTFYSPPTSTFSSLV